MPLHARLIASCRPSNPMLLAVASIPLVVMAGLAGSEPLLAHEAGTTRVVAALARDTYGIVVTTDASALLARLELARQRRRTSPSTPAEYQKRFDELCDEVTLHVAVAFNDIPSTPRATCRVESEGREGGVTSDELEPFSVPGVTVTLEGVVPRDAGTIRWRYGLTSASYSLTLATPRPDEAQTVWIEGDETRTLALGRVAEAPSARKVAREYVELGFTHILPKGLDHILFVLGLFLLSRRAQPLLWQVSAFTLAHTMTLGLTLYGLIELPSSIVEPLIALSIVYVAIENLMTSELKPWRVALVFGFGLLHGMGFAGVLRELPLPPSQLLVGLAAFNVGVEAGQLTVLLLAFIVMRLWIRRGESYRRLVVVPGSAAIALAGLVWTVERLML